MNSLLKLKRNPGAVQAKKRLGRGNGSGLGTYSGKGGKGQTARSGGSIKPGFAGGQTPLYRKMPKFRGFTSPNRIEYQVINVKDLNVFDDNSEVTVKSLYEKKLVSFADRPVKILGDGSLEKKLQIKVDSVSKSAQEKITAAKGSVEK